MKKFYIFDSNSIIHRFFHALPPFTHNGQPVGAIYGLSGFLLSVFMEEKPDYIAAAFDRPEPTFRDAMFKDYKAHRPPTANEIIDQLKEAKNTFALFNIPVLDLAGYEADDIIGTLPEKLKNDPEIIFEIFSSDNDILQLVEGSRVTVRLIKNGLKNAAVYHEPDVEEKFGVLPNQLADYKGLVGDTSDNIPGIMGVGPKTAVMLLKEFKSVEGIFDNLGLIPQKKLEKINGHQEEAFLSKKLATINRNAPIEIKNLEQFKSQELNKEAVKDYFEKKGFGSLVKRMEGPLI